VFVHGIASRTLAGLAKAAERGETPLPVPRGPAAADATRVVSSTNGGHA
jgi:hypothetical protein